MFATSHADDSFTGHTDYVPYTRQIEQRYKIKPNLLVAICSKESNWRNVRGKHGEIGVCQVKPESAALALGSTTKRPVLAYGSRGDYVRFAQALLKIKPDGAYGRATELQVKMFQYHNGLRVDGVISKQTWYFLAGPESYTQMLWNPRQNIELAARYLVWLRDLLSTDDAVILMAAYNGGPGNPVVKYMVAVERYRQSLNPMYEAYLMEDLR
jgi:murein L,D-transpeptidase YcbB/YkuD